MSAMSGLTQRIGEWRDGDRIADRVGAVASKVVGRPGRFKDLLSGTWLGHALHPVLTDVPIGAWTSALILDLVGGEKARPAADTLVGVGIVAALPTAVTGTSDWVDTVEKERRIGLVHAMSNSAALVLYGLSWLARRSGKRRSGVALSLLGAGAMSAGAYLGGHLVYNHGIGVDHAVFEEQPEDWVPVIEASALTDARPHCVEAGDADVLVVKLGSTIHAIANRCTHRGGPLHEGPVEGTAVTCPWHGSRFSLVDGSIERGPATVPQKAYEVRIANGMVEVRVRRAPLA